MYMQPKPDYARLRRTQTVLGKLLRLGKAVLNSTAPVVDLLVRLLLAQVFFLSGILKVVDWDHAIFLATHEYPVSWLSPVTAAYLGGITEMLGSVLLATGLFTRLSALALVALCIVIHTHYVALDTNLFWIALLGWYAVHGAGYWSIDRMLRHGLSDSALPLAESVAGFTRFLFDKLGPLYRLLFRAWIGLTLIATGQNVVGEQLSQLSDAGILLFPVKSATIFPMAFAVVCGTLLLTGLGSRLVALWLSLAVLTAQMYDPHLVDSVYWLAAFALIIVYGPGYCAADRGLLSLMQRWVIPSEQGANTHANPRVVIIGAGFGGISCANALRYADVSVTIVDKRNHHLFQPLLYQVATTTLSPSDIAVPVRSLFREQANVDVVLGEVSAIDRINRKVLAGTKRIPFDYLVIATGSSHSYFGRDDWAPCAPGLKRVEDATEVRRRLLRAFELAESADSDTERDALLTFLIVGAGPTGVELAGAIAELARHGLAEEFRHIDPASAKVILVQSGARILPTFPEALSMKAQRSLENLGVTVRLNSRVESISADGVVVNGDRIAAHTVFWAAGVTASPAAQWLDAKADRSGRIKVGPDLSVPELNNVFAIGDTAHSEAWNGQPVPGLAPAAKQQGAYVAKCILKDLRGQPRPAPFRYQHLGSLATIGRKSAVADFGKLRLSGAIAWWLWGAVHIAFLAGLRNRIAVMFDWFWAYLTYRSGTRLITEDNIGSLAGTYKTQLDDVPRPLLSSNRR